MKNKNTITVVIILFLIGLFSPVCFHAAYAGEIRLATQPIPHYAPVFVAKEKKWIEEELVRSGLSGVNVKWTSFSAGPPMNESFAAGQQDIGFLGDTPAIIAKAAGINTRIVGLTADGPKSLAVIVPKNSSIKTPKDLRGKKVAVVKGSYAHHLLVLVLKKGGLTVNDIQLINLSQADIATSIINGNIDAAAVWEPLITKLESQNVIRILTDGSGIKKGVLVIISSEEYLNRHREEVKALLRAYVRGAKFIATNPAEAARIIAADVSLPQDLLLKVFPKFNYNPAIHGDDIQELKKSETFMRSAKLIKTAVNIDTFIDLKIGHESGIK